MGGDYTRFTFDPEKNYAGVRKQQGRVDVDADWNEQVDIDQRRWRAETMDIMGTAVVPRHTTSQAFAIGFDDDDRMTIGPGRIYVDGILVENHGALPREFDPELAEETGTGPIQYEEQPYFYPEPPALPDIGDYLIYLDVWQREVTAIQDPQIKEIALGGADTAARLQTVWQVKNCPAQGREHCYTPIPGDQPSQGRLSTLPVVPGDEDHPCLVKPAGGYRGLENRLYRVEIHQRGGLGTARFKWSRDNGSVVSAVREIIAGTELTEIALESLGRDQVLSFRVGDWVEVLDDHLELLGQPGELAKVEEIDEADQRIRVRLAEGAGSLRSVDPLAHTRVRRWDQGEAAEDDGLMPVSGEEIELEEGIRISFSTDPADGSFKTGDYWVFAVRTADGSVELLEDAPPRGIHHHYAPLAVVDLGLHERLHECRIFWPPAVSQAEGCDCTVCVTADSYNNNGFTIQEAIEEVERTGGGTVCLGAGDYWLEDTVTISGARSLRVRGQGWKTTLWYTGSDEAIQIGYFSNGVTVENLRIVTWGGGGGIRLSNSMNIMLQSCSIDCRGITDASSDLSHTSTGSRGGPAISMGNTLIQTQIRDCTLVANDGLQIFEIDIDADSEDENKMRLLLTYGLYIDDNYIWCDHAGIDLKGFCFHLGETRIAGNFVRKCQNGAIIAAGLAIGRAGVDIKGNELRVSGHGIVAGSNNMRISDNDISPEGTELIGDGIALDIEWGENLSDTFMDQFQSIIQVSHCHVTHNRILGVPEDGIAIRSRLRSALIEGNIIDRVGRNGICMYNPLGSNTLSIRNNQILNIASELPSQIVHGIRLLNAKHIDVTGNKIMGVGQIAGVDFQRSGILLVACLSQKIAGNEITQIGPEVYTDTAESAESVGIQILAPFEHTEITDNVVRRTASSLEQSFNWIALQIKLPVDYQLEIANGILLRLISDAAGNIHLISEPGEELITTFSEDARQMTVQANRFEARGGLQAVNIVGRGVCLFNNNRCLRYSGTFTPEPAVWLEAEAVVANANSIAVSPIGNLVCPAIHIQAPSEDVTVLSNITYGSIHIESEGHDMGPPWDALNVIKS